MPAADYELVNVKVEVSSNEINYANLIINQRLADVNSFSFIWHIRDGQSDINAQIKFYKDNMGKPVTITVSDGITFKGYIQGINCYNQYENNTEYEISGKGLFMVLDEVMQCKSYTDKTLKDVITDQCKSLSTKINPTNTDKLYYTVQYNQTGFEFIRMLAARYGQWLYYNGSELVFGDYDKGSPYKLFLKTGHVQDINFSVKMYKPSENIVGFDNYKGEKLEFKQQPQTPSGTGLVEAAANAGKQTYGSDFENLHFAHAPNNDVMKTMGENYQNSFSSSSVFVSGRSYLTGLKLGGVIELMTDDKTSAGQYIVVELYHSSNKNNNYQNHFVAIPVEVAIPPYTNPNLFPVCKAQIGVVKENEDKDGLARMKINFPWMSNNETTRWISMLVPHAGKDKGFRFLPEKDEEVMVDFINNNAERPFVLGAVYTDKDKSGVPHDGNNVKIIGTKTGRRLEINDDKGFIKIQDFDFSGNKEEQKGNQLVLVKNDKENYVLVDSGMDDKNFSQIKLTNNKAVDLAVKRNDEFVCTISIDAENKKITLASEGSIELNAKGTINMNASEINMNANAKASFNKDGASIEAKKIEVTAEQNIETSSGMKTTLASGTDMNVSAGTKMELAGGAMAKLQAPTVMIN